MPQRYFMRSSQWIVMVLCGSCLLVSCGGAGSSATPAPPVTLQSISVSPQSATLAAGLTQQYGATGKYSDGTSQAMSGVTWSTSDATLATISSSGMLTALKQGAVTVSATSGTTTGSTPLTVGPPNLLSISVSPQSATLAAGLTQQYSATGKYSDGTSQAMSGVTWSTSDATLATISSSGMLTALKQGAVTVSATSGTTTGNTALTVG